MERSEAQAREEAFNALIGDYPGGATKVPIPRPLGTLEPWPEGIFATGQSTLPTSQFVFENQWQADVDGRHVQVHAGAEGGENLHPGRGVLVVTMMSLDLKVLPEGGIFPAPLDTASLHIVSYEGSRLTLESLSGEVFYFDASRGEFSDNEGNPVPTDQPTASPAPPPTGNATLPPIEFETPIATVAPTPGQRGN